MLHDRVHSPVLSAVDNSAVAALAVAAALSGDRTRAASSLAALCGSDLAGLPRSSSWLVTMNGVVEAAYLLEEADVAARAYELLRPYADLPMIGSLGITCFGSAQHALGVAALTSRQLDEAIEHLHAAVQHNLALAHWPALVASRQRLAQAYALRGSPGDAEAARREREVASSEASAVGLPVPDHRGSEPSATVAQVNIAQCHRVGRKWRLTLRNRSTCARRCTPARAAPTGRADATRPQVERGGTTWTAPVDDPAGSGDGPVAPDPGRPREPPGAPSFLQGPRDRRHRARRGLTGAPGPFGPKDFHPERTWT